jgi:hypothetical protein
VSGISSFRAEEMCLVETTTLTLKNEDLNRIPSFALIFFLHAGVCCVVACVSCVSMWVYVYVVCACVVCAWRLYVCVHRVGAVCMRVYVYVVCAVRARGVCCACVCVVCAVFLFF